MFARCNQKKNNLNMNSLKPPEAPVYHENQNLVSCYKNVLPATIFERALLIAKIYDHKWIPLKFEILHEFLSDGGKVFAGLKISVNTEKYREDNNDVYGQSINYFKPNFPYKGRVVVTSWEIILKEKATNSSSPITQIVNSSRKMFKWQDGFFTSP